jgi:signal transduction histidine kinase/CheY-like chemotaxis protein
LTDSISRAHHGASVQPARHRFRRRAGILRAPLLGAALLCLRPATAGGAEEPAPAIPAAAAPVTSFQSYWDLPLAMRSRGVDYRIEADVTYYDPDWGMLWLQDESNGVYFRPGSEKLPFAQGQRIRLTGHFPAGADPTLQGASFEILGPARLAPCALPSSGWIDKTEPFTNRLVSLEAHVDKQVLTDPEHLHLFLSVDGRPVYAWLRIVPGEPEPQFAQTNIRLRGIFTIRRTTDRKADSIELKIQHPSHIEILGRLADDPRFTRPVSALSTLPQRSPDTLVHIVGSVRSQQPGSALVLRDDTGQIEVLSGQSLPCRIGESVEAIGYPEISGTEWKLRAGLYRPCKSQPATDAPSATPGLSTLHLAAQVLELTAAEAERRYPVELTGVVTWAHPDAPFFFIQDSSGGIAILRSDDPARTLQPGRSVVIRGISSMGSFAPAVVAENIRKTGDMPLPRAESISLEHALTGRAEAQLVEIGGLVRAIHRERLWNRIELTTSAGDFFALLPAADALPDVVGAVVRVRGVCAAETDAQRRLRGIRLWVRSPEDIQIEEAAPRDLFALPAQSLAELGRFGAPQSLAHRVRLSGTVLAQLPGRWVQIQEGDISLRVLARDPAPFAPGERIEAVGYLDRKGGRRVLREAVCRAAGTGPSPAPARFGGSVSEASALDGRLVVAEGQLLDSIRTGDETRMNLLSTGGVFGVVAECPLAAKLALHSEVAITGLMDVVYDEQGQPAGFHVRPRTAADVALLNTPSWFTPHRLLGIAAALGFCIGLALLWVAALHRRVKQQTDQIREQVQREARLEGELQRATRLESLGLLAGGIAHDFNNLLTVIIGNLSMVTLGSDLEPEAKGHVGAASRATLRARDLTQQLLTFAKGGSPVRTALSLTDLVQEVADFVLRGTGVDCEFTYASDLWPAHVDKGQISQVVQNLVINAIQAMPDGGHIRIDLRNEEIAADSSRLLAPGHYLHMSIADTGSGIAPEVLPRIFDPYFTTKKTGNGIGLATVFSIVRKHGGHITVESTVGTGTTFHLHLPASDETPATSAPHQLTVDTATLSGRVLLMDDEPEIRRLAGQMMQHLGLEVHCVADGAAAAAEYSRALRDGRRYDIVILDLTVPGGIGGLQALRLLREADPDVCAVVSSGYSEDEVMAAYHKHGFRAIVSKPYGISELARALRPLLRDTAAPSDIHGAGATP